MDVTQSFNLIYTGLSSPQHMLEAVKAEIALSAADNARLADWFLKQADAFNATSRKRQQFAIQAKDYANLASANRLADYVKHIHAAKEQEIKERMTQPELSESEASELLFKMTLERELEKIKPKETTIEINL